MIVFHIKKSNGKVTLVIKMCVYIYILASLQIYLYYLITCLNTISLLFIHEITDIKLKNLLYFTYLLSTISFFIISQSSFSGVIFLLFAMILNTYYFKMIWKCDEIVCTYAKLQTLLVPYIIYLIITCVIYQITYSNKIIINNNFENYLIDEKLEEIQECVICKEENKNNFVKIKNCNHTFHNECIKNWLNIKTECPLCKRSIF